MKKVKSLFDVNYKVTKTEDYLVDISYGQKDWTMVSALREVLANMLDTKTDYHYYYENGVATISDKGEGLPRKAFVFGASSKTNDNTSIGFYGEGLKMCFITALRNNRKVSVKTIDYGVEITSTHSDEYNTELMRLLFNDNAQNIGTTIKVECTQEEWDSALDLFLQFKEGYQRLDTHLFLPGGYVCILGLKTEEKPNMVFSYDLNDKTITNRDRNTVKTRQLKANMEKILNSIKNQKAIRMYFSALEETSDAEEFKITLDPKYKEIWTTVIKKHYGENAVFSTTIENDIKASANGYKVIRTTSKAVQKTLANLGIQSSKDASKGVKSNVGIIENDKITYPISKNYVDSWSYLDAGREFLANALDSSTTEEDAIIYYKDGYCIIEDNGKGIERKNFVIGNSQKDTTDIGMFGEGLKLSSLVMAREERDLVIETSGFNYYPLLEESKEFGTEIFSIRFEQNHQESGTTIKFKATENEVNEIKNLFINFKDNLKRVKFQNVEIILNESNNIYVNGLKTSTIESIFSYNIKDKRLVNSRDRNNINDSILYDYLKSSFDTIEDEYIIKQFLTQWKQSIRFYEYKLIINPLNLTLWKEIATKSFENTCLSSHDMEENFIAKKAGYQILVDLPPYVKEILSYCLPSSSEIATKYKEKGILLGNKILYPISIHYAENWNIKNAIIELISNAIDTNSNLNIEYNKNSIIIEDEGEGFEKKNLIFGVTNKNTVGEAIGSFGEGLKMSSLVLARNNRNLKIETVGFSVEVSIEHDSEFDSDILVFEISSNTREKGTKITFSGEEKELTDAKSHFLMFNDKFTKLSNDEEIYSPGGFIFVNGVKISSVNSLYSYNILGFEGKSLLNRDRNSLNLQSAMYSVVNMISHTSSKEVMENILKMRNSNLFENFGYMYSSSIKGPKIRSWRSVAEKIYTKCCLPVNNSEINLVAKDKGYKVLIDISETLNTILRTIKFPCSNDVVTLRGDEDVARKIISPDDLSSDGKLKWNIINKVISAEYGELILNCILICEEFVNPDDGKTLGQYNSRTGNCYILREILDSKKYTTAEVLGVVIHEITHKISGEYDRTRGFENALTNIIGDLVYKLYVSN